MSGKPFQSGRPFPRHTTLGKLMHHKGLTVKAVEHGTGIYNRTLTEYLAGRKTPIASHRRALAAFLELPEAVLDLPPAQVDAVLSRRATSTPST